MKLSRIASVAAVWLVALLAGAPAASQPRTPVDISPCVGIDSALARLDCYDALARAAAQTASAPAPARPDNPVPPTPSARPPAESVSPPAAARSEPATLDEITSEIVALRELAPGRFEIELANGQLWRQTSSDRYRLRVGQEARVYRAREGDRFFRLTVAALRGFVQVERAR